MEGTGTQVPRPVTRPFAWTFCNRDFSVSGLPTNQARGEKRATGYRMLCRDLFEREGRNVRSFTGVLNRDATDLAIPIHIQDRVLVKIASLRHISFAKLD
jgi:hypothetical protein